MKNININKQTGFTLTEMVIVVVIITLLVVGLSSAYGRYKENAKTTVAQKMILEHMSAAIASYESRKGTLTGISKIELVDNGVKTITPWGDSWSMTGPASGLITITFPLTSSPFADTTGPDMSSFITGAATSTVTSITYASGSKSLTIVIQS